MDNILKELIPASVITGFKKKGLLIKKIINTFLYPTWLYKIIIDEKKIRLFYTSLSQD